MRKGAKKFEISVWSLAEIAEMTRGGSLPGNRPVEFSMFNVECSMFLPISNLTFPLPTFLLLLFEVLPQAGKPFPIPHFEFRIPAAGRQNAFN